MLIKRNSSLILLLLFVCCRQNIEKESISSEQFTNVLKQISDGWNEGNARKAVDVFAVDAVYEEPPRKQYYKGHTAIFEFFGGDKGFNRPMKMRWHNVAFNEDAQIGFGEYTFAMNKQYHGIVAIKIKNGKIALWREYQYESSMDWKEFSGDSEFHSMH
ncbi:MAG TPA: nuclear transport factor 2 family protein [Chryseolinea sp.]|nr:nuclear transport factor 2 family protein [Chryseolinea sp.]